MRELKPGFENNMRARFAHSLHQVMKDNKDVFLLVGDLGYKIFDDLREDYPDRILNMGAAEQAMMGAAVGLALAGKVPFVYSITPFLLARPFETIRLYISHENVPVKLIGGGRDSDYAHDGFSHYAGDDEDIISTLNLEATSYWPEKAEEITSEFITNMVVDKNPQYLNLKR